MNTYAYTHRFQPLLFAAFLLVSCGKNVSDDIDTAEKWTDPIGTHCHSFCIRMPISHEEMVERVLRHITKKYESIAIEK